MKKSFNQLLVPGETYTAFHFSLIKSTANA